MAGRRRAAGKPFHADAARARRRALYVQRRGRARTAGQRVYAAADYLAGALADLTPAAASALAATAVGHLETLAKRAEVEQRRRRSR